jgi:single-strand DNA-binding protein
MPNLNKSLLCGHLTRDPELKFTASGKAIGNTGLAVSEKYKSGEQMKEEVTFIDIEVWGKQAETLAQYCKKGACIFIEGRLKLDQWDDKQTGQKRSKLKVVADRIQFINTRTGEAPVKAKDDAPKPVENDDDPLPF